MALLLDVFSGKSQTYSDGDITFKTAIKKSPLHGNVEIDFSGVVGNEIANHKNALYAFSHENYDYWRENSNLDMPWQSGTFGENLIVSGIGEQDLFIGDMLKIGEVTLIVSGCRTPCSNLLWRLGAPESFLPIFQRSGRSGFYLEVVSTGLIKAGQTIEYIPTKALSISVADLALFFMNPNPDADELGRLIHIKGMGQQMLSMLTASLNVQRERELVFQNRWVGWQPFTISNIVYESSDVKSFYLTKNSVVNDVAGYRAGQYIVVKLIDDSKEQLVRCWSLSDYDETLQQYRISIKREPNGNASQLIHDKYVIGDKLEIMAPMGQFTLKRDDIAVPVVLISAGVGITPMISMLKSHASRLDKDLPTLHFIHSTQSASSHAFKEEVSEIINNHDNFHQHIIYTRADESAKLGVDFQQDKRLDADSLNTVLSGMGCWFAEKWIEVAPFECQYYLCGPSNFLQQTKLMLADLGVPEEAIYDESFTSSSDINIDKTQRSVDVNFTKSAKKVNWQPEKPMTLLELAEDNGLSPAFSCRSGHCGLCATKIKNGTVDYISTPAAVVAEESVLLCCAIPSSDVQLDL